MFESQSQKHQTSNFEDGLYHIIPGTVYGFGFTYVYLWKQISAL